MDAKLQQLLPNALTGGDLLVKILKLKDDAQDVLIIKCGYFIRQENNVRLYRYAFFNEMLTAKGVNTENPLHRVSLLGYATVPCEGNIQKALEEFPVKPKSPKERLLERLRS